MGVNRRLVHPLNGSQGVNRMLVHPSFWAGKRGFMDCVLPLGVRALAEYGTHLKGRRPHDRAKASGLRFSRGADPTTEQHIKGAPTREPSKANGGQKCVNVVVVPAFRVSPAGGCCSAGAWCFWAAVALCFVFPLFLFSRRLDGRGRHVPAPAREGRRVTSEGHRPKNRILRQESPGRKAFDFAYLLSDLLYCHVFSLAACRDLRCATSCGRTRCCDAYRDLQGVQRARHVRGDPCRTVYVRVETRDGHCDGLLRRCFASLFPGLQILFCTSRPTESRTSSCSSRSMCTPFS